MIWPFWTSLFFFEPDYVYELMICYKYTICVYWDRKFVIRQGV